MSNLLQLNLLLGMFNVTMGILVIRWLMPRPQNLTWPLTAHHLLLLGICAGFASSVGDNVYWGLAWYSRIKNWPTEAYWFHYGPISNTVFRHLMKIVAAACHLEAARRSHAVDGAQLATETSICVFCSAVLWLLLV